MRSSMVQEKLCIDTSGMALHGGCTLLYPALATSGTSVVAALRSDIDHVRPCKLANVQKL